MFNPAEQDAREDQAAKRTRTDDDAGEVLCTDPSLLTVHPCADDALPLLSIEQNEVSAASAASSPPAPVTTLKNLDVTRGEEDSATIVYRTLAARACKLRYASSDRSTADAVSAELHIRVDMAKAVFCAAGYQHYPAQVTAAVYVSKRSRMVGQFLDHSHTPPRPVALSPSLAEPIQILQLRTGVGKTAISVVGTVLSLIRPGVDENRAMVDVRGAVFQVDMPETQRLAVVYAPAELTSQWEKTIQRILSAFAATVPNFTSTLLVNPRPNVSLSADSFANDKVVIVLLTSKACSTNERLLTLLGSQARPRMDPSLGTSGYDTMAMATMLPRIVLVDEAHAMPTLQPVFGVRIIYISASLKRPVPDQGVLATLRERLTRFRRDGHTELASWDLLVRSLSVYDAAEIYRWARTRVLLPTLVDAIHREMLPGRQDTVAYSVHLRAPVLLDEESAAFAAQPLHALATTLTARLGKRVTAADIMVLDAHVIDMEHLRRMVSARLVEVNAFPEFNTSAQVIASGGSAMLRRDKENLVERVRDTVVRLSKPSDHDCAVCLRPLDAGPAVMPCCLQLALHNDCANTWLQRSPHCPLCRAPMRHALAAGTGPLVAPAASPPLPIIPAGATVADAMAVLFAHADATERVFTRFLNTLIRGWIAFARQEKRILRILVASKTPAAAARFEATSNELGADTFHVTNLIAKGTTAAPATVAGEHRKQTAFVTPPAVPGTAQVRVLVTTQLGYNQNTLDGLDLQGLDAAVAVGDVDRHQCLGRLARLAGPLAQQDEKRPMQVFLHIRLDR